MAVLNDFEACGYGVPALQPEDLLILNDVPARQKVSPQLHLLDHTQKVQLHHATSHTKFEVFCGAQHCLQAKVRELLGSSVPYIVPSQHNKKTPSPLHILKLCTVNSQDC